MTPSCHPASSHGTAQQHPRTSAASEDWWRSAVVYQVYIRSFADGNGDGIGDIAGLQDRLPYLVELGVDALWLNPWYPSPMADGGYDVSDYRAIDPMFGTLEEAESMMKEAHGLGLKVFLDIVPNHTSDQHHWFREALAAGPGSTARDRYVFRAGRGSGGSLPPNNWRSGFGGPAWVRVTEPDGTPGQWYLHLFAPEQPDLNWDNAEVRREFEAVLRFWFDMGVDGIRIDVAHGLVKEEGLPDLGHSDIERIGMAADGGHPHWDREGVHAIFRGWRAIANSYDEPRVFVAEAWMGAPDRLARYVRPDELHTAFNFDYLTAPWRADRLREAIDNNLKAFGAVGAPTTWVLSNHDVARHVSRYGRPQPDEPVRALSDFLKDKPFDLELGTRRARAAALLTLALPGGAYIYQGEELGLWEIEDLPEELLQDPTWKRSGGTDRGRDGCRVPIPWSGDCPPFGYSPPAVTTEPWLPQPTEWKKLTVQAQSGDEKSVLELYRKALHLRRAHPALGDGTMTWDSTAQEEVLSFTREPGFRCVVNLSEHQIALPDHTEVILSSAPVHGRRLQSDTAIWLTR
ncbi:glycoside hydrolase family 13 protein [Streptomyces sp. CA-210063]|uniref:glycoside hydrolase family 13 protein n=1 Tax=Streptomyces sp. CA-210063 TaxID=2801029 RepID=UPI00214C7E3F|nr:glycoside hydrolase family 13 protein [Streptomyces sp. CA-210063]UUU32011.1 glycoside hydrolase family 13 protein [Streptomyces sp. CA-210063]